MERFNIAMKLPRGSRPTPQAIPTSVQRIAENLRRSHMGLKEFVEASEKAAREACADILVLQGQLQEETLYQTTLVTMLTNLVGVEAMQGILGQVDVEERECRVTWLNQSREKRTRHSLNSTPAQHSSSNPPYHVFSSNLKRIRDDLKELEDETSYRHKRPRLGRHTTRTILDYTSDNITDNTYSDSNGTESDFVDDHYSFFDHRGRPPCAELRGESSSGEQSQSDTDNSPKGVRWSRIPDFEDDDSRDSDYQPPDWDMEDIWELEATHKSPKHPLYRFAYDKELRQCEGDMSDASLSTDDPDAGYNDAGKLSFAATTRWFGFSLSLGPPLERLPWDKVADYRPAHRHSYDLIPPRREEAIARYRLSLWNNIRDMAEDGFEFESPVDFEQRLNDLLGSDHQQFYFDDKEWTKFGPPPVSSRQPEPRSPKVLDLLEERWFLFLGPDSE